MFFCVLALDIGLFALTQASTSIATTTMIDPSSRHQDSVNLDQRHQTMLVVNKVEQAFHRISRHRRTTEFEQHASLLQPWRENSSSAYH
jgi:hypothetical protein